VAEANANGLLSMGGYLLAIFIGFAFSLLHLSPYLMFFLLIFNYFLAYFIISSLQDSLKRENLEKEI
jgi:uncharacterized membrane protein